VFTALLDLNHSVAFILDFAKDYVTTSDQKIFSPSMATSDAIAASDLGRRRTESAVLPHELPNVVIFLSTTFLLFLAE
jgi:hypothetical protein